jgi:hypothetical protein
MVPYSVELDTYTKNKNHNRYQGQSYKGAHMTKETEEKLRKEVVALRGEVKQLREVVNMLLAMVMEHDGDEYDIEFGDFKMDRNSNLKLGM